MGSFSVFDYIVFIGSLLFSLIIGLYYSLYKKQNDPEDFLLAGRSMSPIPVALSLLASFVSAITILAVPAEAYYNGLQLSLTIPSNVLAVIFVGTTLMPLLYTLKITSIYEYLEQRFESKLLRIIATLTFLTKTTFYMSIVLYTPAIALSVVTPLPTSISIITVGAICTLYTGLGGLRAVVWTDVFQVFMMFSGVLCIVIQGCIKLGGVEEIWEIASRHQRTMFFDFTFDPFLRCNFWSMLIGNTLASISVYGCSQISVQRYLCMRSYREAKFALFSNIPMKVTMTSLAYLSGLVAFAVYADCDPKSAGIITRSDEIMPYYVMDKLGYITGLPGLFVACVFSASLSTLSSGLNAMAACTWEDFVSPTRVGSWIKNKNASLYFSKLLSFTFGIISILLAFSIGEFGTIIDALLTITGAITGPVFATFFVAIFIPWCNRQGMTAGIIVGNIVCIMLAGGSLITGKKTINPPLPLSTEQCSQPFNVSVAPSTPISPLWKESFEMSDMFRISFMWYTVIGVIVTLIVALPVSQATGNQDLSKLDKVLLHPCLHNYIAKKQKKLANKSNKKSSDYEMNSHVNKCYSKQ